MAFIRWRPLIGSMLTLGATSSTRTLQASRFLPPIIMASEPQTPWAQDRRNDNVPS